MWKFYLQISFPQKPQFCFYGIYKIIILELQIWFGCFLAFLFNWWYSPLAWWHLQGLNMRFQRSFVQYFIFFLRLQPFQFTSAFLLSDGIDQLQQFRNSICPFQKWCLASSRMQMFSSFQNFQSSFRKVIFYRYNQLLCRVQCRMCRAVRHPKPAYL